MTKASWWTNPWATIAAIVLGMGWGALMNEWAGQRLLVSKAAPPETVPPPGSVAASPETAAPPAVDAAARTELVPGPLAVPLGNGWALKLDEPVQDPVVSSSGLVVLRATLTNLREERVRTFEFWDVEPRAFDDFGNRYHASTGQHHHRRHELYPRESSEPRTLEWVFGRPVPGATVHYEIGLTAGRTGLVRKFWPAAPPVVTIPLSAPFYPGGGVASRAADRRAREIVTRFAQQVTRDAPADRAGNEPGPYEE